MWTGVMLACAMNGQCMMFTENPPVTKFSDEETCLQAVGTAALAMQEHPNFEGVKIRFKCVDWGRDA